MLGRREGAPELRPAAHTWLTGRGRASLGWPHRCTGLDPPLPPHPPSMPCSCCAVSPATMSLAWPRRRVSHTRVLMPAAANTGSARRRHSRRPWRRPEFGFSSTSRLLQGWAPGGATTQAMNAAPHKVGFAENAAVALAGCLCCAPIGSGRLMQRARSSCCLPGPPGARALDAPDYGGAQVLHCLLGCGLYEQLAREPLARLACGTAKGEHLQRGWQGPVCRRGGAAALQVSGHCLAREHDLHRQASISVRPQAREAPAAGVCGPAGRSACRAARRGTLPTASR